MDDASLLRCLAGFLTLGGLLLAFLIYCCCSPDVR